jgi:hypothetical protein
LTLGNQFLSFKTSPPERQHVHRWACRGRQAVAVVRREMEICDGTSKSSPHERASMEPPADEGIARSARRNSSGVWTNASSGRGKGIRFYGSRTRRARSEGLEGVLFCPTGLATNLARWVPDDERVELVLEDQQRYRDVSKLIVQDVANSPVARNSCGASKIAKWSFVPKGFLQFRLCTSSAVSRQPGADQSWEIRTGLGRS